MSMGQANSTVAPPDQKVNQADISFFNNETCKDIVVRDICRLKFVVRKGKLLAGRRRFRRSVRSRRENAVVVFRTVAMVMKPFFHHLQRGLIS
jgi:hypothetical protein